MASIHDNPERGEMILRAIKQNESFQDAMTIENVREKLPRDFDLSPEEFEEGVAELAPPPPEPTPRKRPPGELITTTPDGNPLALPPETNDGADAPADEASMTASSPQAVGPVAEPSLSFEESSARVFDVNNRHSEALIALRVANDKVATARGVLARAIVAWQTQSDGRTMEERRQANVRDHLASEQAKRQARGTSRTAAAFVQKNMRNGPNRGAFPAKYQHQRVRVPSEA